MKPALAFIAGIALVLSATAIITLIASLPARAEDFPHGLAYTIAGATLMAVFCASLGIGITSFKGDNGSDQDPPGSCPCG